MIEPTHAKIETSDVLILSSRSDCFLHCWNSFAVAAKVCLQDGQIKQGILIECAVYALHTIVKVTMEIIEG